MIKNKIKKANFFEKKQAIKYGLMSDGWDNKNEYKFKKWSILN